MSHCCGGCGGENPSEKKNRETSEKEADKQQDKNSAEKATSPTGTWQPAGK